MSGAINIGGDKADPTYRYKMPPLVTKIEGRGNGIKTVILNMSDIAKSLHIHPEYPTKYFGIEVGAQSRFSASTDRAVVNGSHQQADLAKILERFIQGFILCPTCKLPELKMSVKSQIKIDCAACGHNSVLKSTHKLTQYILKNPPNSLSGAKKKDETEDEKGDKKKGGKREHKKDKKKKKAEEDNDDAEANGDDAEGSEEDVSEEESSPAEKQKKSKSKDKKERVDEEEVWYTDTSKEAQAARKEAEFAEARQAAEAASNIEKIIELSLKPGEKQNESATTALKIFLANDGRTIPEIRAELKRVALARGLDQPGKYRTLVEALYDTAAPSDAKAVAALFHTRAPLLAHFAEDRQSQLALVNAVEELLGTTHKEMIAAVPHVLQQLYNDDILDEETITGWYDSPPESSWLVKKDVAELVRARAKVFVEWLKTAESDEEDEDEDA